LPWTNFNLKDINPNLEAIPVKEYTWELLPGTKYDEKNRVIAQAAIVNDGEFTGRRITFSYPDPETFDSKGKKNDWAGKMLKRLENAIGIESEDQEDVVFYLNRVAGNRFSAKVKLGKTSEDYPTPRTELDIFNVRPAQ
jgi:hypothetical protein